YTAARLINQCIPVGHVMKRRISYFETTQLLSDIKGTIDSTNFRNYPVVEKGKLVGLVSRDNLMVPEPEQVILVDHNERGQAVEGIENARILEIIDHHRLGGMQTGDPIFIREEPVGCTATIVANMYWQNDMLIEPPIAGLLLSAILSDTVLFKSPTCTPYDKKTAERLAAIAGVELRKYGLDMLKAGSGIGSMTPMEIARNDMKEFEIGDYHILVSQLSVMDTAEVMAIKDKILSSMKSVCEQDEFDLCLLMVTNILEESTELLYVGSPKTLIGEAFKKDASGDSIYLPGVMSRKKQIIPPLSEAVRRMAN
ncbi:MAG: putative manganese-dependent inorganic diphosphatase, partial [Schwartzia sp.]|nr:putative manganese-dependent inorganic diphosphatase [Schwartzia sp. (in: firmicutes)]